MNEDKLNYLDDILMRNAEELMSDNFIDEVLAIESLAESDEEYTDIDTLVCEEGFVSKTRSAIFAKKDQKRKENEAEQKRLEEEKYCKEAKAIIMKYKSEYSSQLSDLMTKGKKISEIRHNNIRNKIWPLYIDAFNYVNKITSGLNSNNVNTEEELEQLKAQIDKKRTEDKKILSEKISAFEKVFSYVKISASQESYTERPIEATESVEFTSFDAAVMVTLGVALFGKVIAHKVDKKDMGVFRSNREARPYYYLLSNEFKKSEKSLKGLLKRNKKFVTSKVALEEIISFRKKYYNRVAMTVNRFMEVFESMENLVGKEKDYTFPDDNPIRDAAITSKLHQRCLKFYELRHSNFTHSAAEVLTYEPSYMKSDDMSKILVDSKYLTELLRPDETFRCIDVLENIIKKIPSIDDANRYEELLVNTKGEAAPLRMYTSTMLDLRDTALEVRSILNAYINVVYAILDFSVLANEKCAIANEGFMTKLKPKHIDYTHLKLAIASFKKIDRNENSEAEMMRIHTQFNSIACLANYIRCNPCDFLGMDVESARERHNLIKETKLLIPVIEKAIKEICRTQASEEFDILDKELILFTFIDELDQGLNILSNSRSSYNGIVVDRKGRELVTELCKKMVEYYKRYDDLLNDITSGKVNRNLDCKKLGLTLLLFPRPDKSNYSYKELMRLINTIIGLKSLSNYIVSYPGYYTGDKKTEVVECTNKAIQLCDRLNNPSFKAFDVYKNHTDCGYAYYLSWYQELKAGLALELNQDYKFDLYEYDEEKGLECKPVVVDKDGLKILGTLISNICIYLDRISEINEAIEEKDKTDPSFYSRWKKEE